MAIRYQDEFGGQGETPLFPGLATLGEEATTTPTETTAPPPSYVEPAPAPAPTPAPAPEEPLAPLGGGGGEEIPAPPGPVSPLALPQSFAQPGTPAAMPYRTGEYFKNRTQGSGLPRQRRFGPGIDLASSPSGDELGIGAPDQRRDEDLVRLIAGNLGRKYGQQ